MTEILIAIEIKTSARTCGKCRFLMYECFPKHRFNCGLFSHCTLKRRFISGKVIRCEQCIQAEVVNDCI